MRYYSLDLPAQATPRRYTQYILGYNDRNDGFCRTFFSRNKSHRSRIRKDGKLNKRQAYIYSPRYWHLADSDPAS